MIELNCPQCSGEACKVCGGTGVITVGATKDSFSREKMRWSPLEDHILQCLHKDYPYSHIAALLGRGVNSVRNRCHEKGWRKQVEDWTPIEIQELALWYAEKGELGRGELKLNDLAAKLGRLPSNVSRKARELGLTDSARPFSEALLTAFRDSCQGLWERREHPKGMAGKKHSDEAKAQMSASQKIAQSKISKEDRSKITSKAVQTKIEKYGTGNPGNKGENAFSRCKRGRREDLGAHFFRSSWEANYARYLNVLVSQGKISKWEYEVDVYVFHGETRGCISYTPDFKVWATDGKSYEYHEVKGWMTSESRTKLKRMAKHYPAEKIIVIGRAEYIPIEKAVISGKLDIPLWEFPTKK